MTVHHNSHSFIVSHCFLSQNFQQTQVGRKLKGKHGPALYSINAESQKDS